MKSLFYLLFFVAISGFGFRIRFSAMLNDKLSHAKTLPPSNQPPFKKVVENSLEYDGYVIQISGKVISLGDQFFKLMGYNSFVLESDDGRSIIVLSDGALPKLGKTYSLSGVFWQIDEPQPGDFLLIQTGSSKLVRTVRPTDEIVSENGI